MNILQSLRYFDLTFVCGLLVYISVESGLLLLIVVTSFMLATVLGIQLYAYQKALKLNRMEKMYRERWLELEELDR